MSFPMMPAPRPAQFLRGQLVYRAGAAGLISVGNPSEDRWLVVVAARFSSSDISDWTAPTVDGVAMTEIEQDYQYASSDGHRGAIWVKRIPTKASVTLAGEPESATLAILTLTGAGDLAANAILSGETDPVQTAAVGAVTVGYFVVNFASVNSVTGMDAIYGGGTSQAVGYDAAMSASPLTYTVTHTGTLILQRKVSWRLNH